MRVRSARLETEPTAERIERWVFFTPPGRVRAALMSAVPREAAREEALPGLTFYDGNGVPRLDIDFGGLPGAAIPVISLGNAAGHPKLYLGLDCGGVMPSLWLENQAG